MNQFFIKPDSSDRYGIFFSQSVTGVIFIPVFQYRINCKPLIYLRYARRPVRSLTTVPVFFFQYQSEFSFHISQQEYYFMTN